MILTFYGDLKKTSEVILSFAGNLHLEIYKIVRFLN